MGDLTLGNEWLGEHSKSPSVFEAQFALDDSLKEYNRQSLRCSYIPETRKPFSGRPLLWNIMINTCGAGITKPI